MYKPLTKKQRAILEFIKAYQKSNNQSPSLEEIKKQFKLKAISTVHEHIDQLCQKGYLFKEQNKARSLQIIDPTLYENHFVEIQILGEISARILKMFTKPRPILINKELLEKNGRYYALQVKGNTLLNDGFFDLDILIIKEQDTAKNRDLILATVQNDIPIIKRYYKEKTRIRLQPLNPKASPRFYKNIDIKGKIISLIRIFDKNHIWIKH